MKTCTTCLAYIPSFASTAQERHYGAICRRTMIRSIVTDELIPLPDEEIYCYQQRSKDSLCGSKAQYHMLRPDLEN